MSGSPDLFRDEDEPEPWEVDFINALASELGVPGQAARKAGVHLRTVERRRSESPRFEALYQAAQRAIDDALEYESLRRALEPNVRPLFARGKVIGEIREYDTKHLEWLLERRMPEVYHIPSRADSRDSRNEIEFRPVLGDNTPEIGPGESS